MKNIYLLNDQNFENVINLEVFKIEFIKKEIDFSKYDALILTSKNAVYSIDSFNKQWKKIPSYVIAPKTANIAKEHGAIINFVGKNGHGNEFAYELIPHLKGKKVLYLKAEKTVSNLLPILKENGIIIESEVIYKTSCNEKCNSIDIKNNSIIIFTSPSSVECFFKKYKWNDTLQAVVIGHTTAKYLPKDIKFIVSEKTSVQECVNLAMKL